MNTLERKSLSYLCSVRGVGQRTLAKLQQLVLGLKSTPHTPEQNWKQFWEGQRQLWQEIGISQRIIESIESKQKEQDIEVFWQELEKRQIRVIGVEDDEYPPLLKQIENHPSILFAKGAVMDWSTGPPVAVVGTRHMTAYGKQATEKIVSELVIGGSPIISGAMYGVDLCAHQTAVNWEGQTVGVLGYGFNYVYPKSYASQFRELLAAGMTFMTPFAPDVAPTKGNFPARNGLVAGMSAALVVTEAAEKSGTMITAQYAADFGRAVYAVPGSVFSPYSAGTRELVNQGAQLISSGGEVLSTIECN